MIPNTEYKKYIIDTASELSQLEATFGNEAYCIENTYTYICNSSGNYVRKRVAGEDALPGITADDNGKILVVDNAGWGKSADAILKPVPSTENIYDEENYSVVQSDPQYTIGTVYLDGYTGNIVISTAGTRAGYFSQLHVYDSAGVDMEVSLGSTVNSVPNGIRQGKLVVIPEGAKYFTFRYRTYSSSSTLISEVMVTKGNTIGTSYIPYEAHYKFVDIVQESIPTAAYVFLNGNDSNDGLTPETAVATFERALSIANVIYAEREIYNQSINISGRNGVRIYPYDNDEEYSSGVERQKIELYGGNKILKSAMTASNNIYTVACSGGFQFVEVFTNHTLEPITNNGQYRANVFVNLTSQGKLKLKPVLTQAGCEAEADTFFWNGTNLICNISTASFDSVTVLVANPKITAENSFDVILQDVALNYTYSSAIKIDNSIDVVLENCEASYSATNMGFEVNNSNVTLNHCYATNNAYDGFNFHGYGYSEMFDCDSMYNFDDGCSHHNGCIGTINGGEFTGNGKGGITPAYGANVNIYDILAVNNDVYGVGFLYTSGNPPMKGLISGCALVNNPIGMRVGTNWTVNAIGVKYSGNTTDKLIEGTCNEFE
jgi:hypothetical protein